MLKRFPIMLGLLLLAVLSSGLSAQAPSDCEGCVITDVELVGDYQALPYIGDLWTTTWADDGNTYTMFGDATGMNRCLPTLLMDEPDEFDADYSEVSPGCYTVNDLDNEYCEVFGCEQCLPLCQYTPAGLLLLNGAPPTFAPCEGEDQCVISRHIPYGDYSVFINSDKPSSLIFINGRMYAHMHYPPGEPTYGYMAYSDDYGRTWNYVDGAPWGIDSPFKVMMFINMGQAYSLNQDGYLYGFGVHNEVANDPQPQAVYLARVPVSPTPIAPEADPILTYSAYEYFAGLDANGAPIWSSQQSDAVPLAGLSTLAQASAMYHAGIQRYIFLSGFVDHVAGNLAGVNTDEPIPVGAVYEAPTPWGPWQRAGYFPGGFIASLIPKGAGENSVYFTGSGGGGLTYNLNIGQLRFNTASAAQTSQLPNPFTLVYTRKVEQVIGDIDFETFSPTRQQTESRFNLAFTDLGVPFEHKGKLWLLFGDSDPESDGWDERHDDAIAYTEATTPEEFYLTVLTDPNSGRGYLNPRIDCPQFGQTDCVHLGTLNAPVAAISDGATMFVWFTTDGATRSVVARSDDDGRTFQWVYDFGSTHFIDLAAALYESDIPGLPAGQAPWVLVFGSGNQTYNQVYLAATPLSSLQQGDSNALRFLSAIDGQTLTWSTDEMDATPIFTIAHGEGPGLMSMVEHGWGFGEPLVHYNRALGLWMATYNAARQQIHMRVAEQPWGTWSEPLVLFDPTQDYGAGPAYGRYIGDDQTERLGGQGELYGPYVLERFTRPFGDNQVQIYWLLSTWQPYTVVLMESVLALP